MSADFGAELDAALNAHLAAVRTAAEAAKDRIDEGVAGVAAPEPLVPEPPPVAAAHHGAAVSFDIVESPLDFGAAPLVDYQLDGIDAEGIPVPEDIEGA